MAKLIVLSVLFQITTLPMQGVLSQDSPFEAIMSNVMQHLNSGSEGDSTTTSSGAIGQLLGSFLQGDNIKNLQGNDQFMNTYAEIVNPPFKENKSISAADKEQLTKDMADTLAVMSVTYKPPEPEPSLSEWLCLLISPILALVHSHPTPTSVNSTNNNSNTTVPPNPCNITSNDTTLRFLSSMMGQMRSGYNMPNQIMPVMPNVNPNSVGSNGGAMNLISSMLQQMQRNNNMPSMNMPSMNMPPMNLPPMNMPSMNMPSMNMPSMNMPSMNLPPMNMPSMNMPSMNLPPMNMPSMNVPPMNMPPMNMRPMNMPPMNMPSMNMPSMNMPPMNMPPMNMPSMNVPPMNMPSMNMPPASFPPNNQMLPGGTTSNNQNQNDFLKNFKMPHPLEMLLSLSGLLGGQNGQIDPNLIGGMLSMFAQQMMAPARNKRQAENDINLEGLMGLASAFMGGNQGAQNGADFLPMIMNAIGSLSNPEAQKRAEEHKDHADFLPPFLEKAHLYWDLFINSELGKTIWEKSGMKKSLKSFTGPDGKISFELMFKNFENQSFRRHWIKAAAKYLTDMVVQIAKPEVYQRYLSSAQYLINGFIDAQGLPKSAHFNMKKPEKSIAALVNTVIKKYLDMDTDVTGYVKPAVEYLKQTVKMAETASQKLASRGDYSAIADRVTDTLNLEVIEPVLRVYRAYQHSVKAPQCQEHLMCLVNRHHDKDKQGLPGFKAGLTKFSSLVASAALSYQNGGGFWDLYNAIQNDVNCDAAYPADCVAFHEHELKVTTEVYHSEL